MPKPELVPNEYLSSISYSPFLNRTMAYVTYLFHVSSSHKFGTKVKVLSVGLFEIQYHIVVCFLKVALISVEYDCLIISIMFNWGL